MNSPDMFKGIDVEIILRSGPGEEGIVVRQHAFVDPEGSTVNIALGPPSNPMTPAMELELYPRRTPAGVGTVPDHHHHPLSDTPCANSRHASDTADARQRHLFAAVYVDPAGLLTMTPWVNLDAAQQAADDRRGVVVAFPVIADFSVGPSMHASGSWPAAKQTAEELAAAQQAHAADQERARQLAAHRDRDPLECDPPAARDPEPTHGFTGFFAPAGLSQHPRTANSYDDEQQYTRHEVRPPFAYDPEDGAGVPFTITEVRR